MFVSCGDDNPVTPPTQDQPEISSISPQVVHAGLEVTISGKYFGNIRDTSKIYFSNTAVVTYSSWSSTQIKVIVPYITASGKLKVVVGGLSSNEVDYQLDDSPIIVSAGLGHGEVGDVVEILGLNFTTEKGQVFFNEINATEISLWSNTRILVQIPENAKSGNIFVKTTEMESNGFYFIIDDNAPVITSLSPTQANVGDEITISGNYFGVTQSASYVEFNGIKATAYTQWSNSSIKVKVPAGATSGDVTVNVGTLESNGSYLIIGNNSPIITTLSATNGKVGDEITITGNNFGNTQTSSYVEFNGIKATAYTQWSNTSIKVKVPVGATSGDVTVTVGAITSNGVNFTVQIDDTNPNITALSSTSFNIGDELIIYGKNFGSKTADSKVFFNAIEAASYSYWFPTSIKVIVPTNATDGKITVSVAGKVSNEVAYTISNVTPEPVISSISPTIAPAGTPIIINGSNFGNSSGQNSYVQFGSTKATADYWSNTQISAVVPDIPGGEISVTVTVNNKKSNGITFRVQSSANVIVPLVQIPAGTFMMGSPNSEDGDAYPQHKVTFTKPLLVGKTEISQAQYKKVMNSLNPSYVVDDDNPVEQVEWYAALDFCNRLSRLEGYTECYTIDGNNVTWNKSANGYRLLTEAEWEYACRAGSTGSIGNKDGSQANINDIAWTTSNSNAMHHVGLLAANDFGLFDMQGNAAELVWDYFSAYTNAAVEDPSGPTNGLEKIFRGGGYIDSPNGCSTFKRYSINAVQVQYYIGFRICRTK
ncbi:MAG: hypothetical protein A2X64_06225 [Ignavibacteria bacterium GWF2_33_9]|nr:MAG: hypothetical protein A2X64_06225 [Ignavibacteria bacterium GWF2_33_9]